MSKTRDGRADSKRRRRRLFFEQDGLCHYCSAVLTLATATLDHIVPRSWGGTGRLANLVLACLPCNEGRGSRLTRCRCDKCLTAMREFFLSHGIPVTFRTEVAS